MLEDTCSLIRDKDTIVDDDDGEDDEEALTPPNDDSAPSIQFTEIKDENIAGSGDGHEAPVPIREKPKRQPEIAMTQEYPAFASFSYEEAIPVDDDSGAYSGKKEMKRAKKKSKGIEYAALEEPPPVPWDEVKAPADDDGGLGNFYLSTTSKKKTSTKKKGKSTLEVDDFGD